MQRPEFHTKDAKIAKDQGVGGSRGLDPHYDCLLLLGLAVSIELAVVLPALAVWLPVPLRFLCALMFKLPVCS